MFDSYAVCDICEAAWRDKAEGCSATWCYWTMYVQDSPLVCVRCCTVAGGCPRPCCEDGLPLCDPSHPDAFQPPRTESQVLADRMDWPGQLSML